MSKLQEVFDCPEPVALVTGSGSRRVGRAIAIHLASLGCRIALHANTSVDQAEDLASHINDKHSTQAHVTQGSLCDEGTPERLVDETVAKFGRIDILVNNAGIHIAKPFTDHSLDEFDHLMKTNVYSVFQLTQQAIRHMQKLGRGKVINVASIAGLRGSMNSAAYNTSKHAIVGLTRCVALENAKHGINVNAICPGIVETDLIKGVEQRMETQGMPPEEFRERILAQIPIGRLLQPEEIANIAVFLASSESDGMSGETISI